MNKKLGIYLSLIAAVLYSVFFIAANTINVCGSGCDYSLIQDALNNASNGDRISVSSEIYNEELSIDKSIILAGESFENKTRLNCGGSGTGITVNSNNTIIKNMEITNCDYGIKILGNKNIIENNTIINHDNSGLYIDSRENKIIQNKIYDNHLGINVLKASENAINFNEIYDNTLYQLKNSDSLSVNAKLNWWGDCTGPGSKINGNADYSQWLGVCIDNLNLSDICVISSDTVNLIAMVTSQTCIKKVVFMVNKDGEWQNFSGSKTLGDNFLTAVTNFSEGQNVLWRVYAEDCYLTFGLSSIHSFNVKSQTRLIISPDIPNGENSWHISRPVFTLENSDSGHIYYRWDSAETFNYSGPFSIENAPNNANISGGKLELNFWSNVCNEEPKKIFIKVDLTSPLVKNIQPKNNADITNKKPLIYSYLDDVYQGNSGINKSSITMKLDGNYVNALVRPDPRESMDAIVSFTVQDELSSGRHDVSVYVEDNAGRETEFSWFFNVAAPIDFNITVNNPMEGIYHDKKTQFNISISKFVKRIEFKNNKDINPKWATLCTNCNEYGLTRKRIKTLNEGDNHIIIRASDEFENIKEKEVTLKIKSELPKIIKTLPRKDNFFNGSGFYAKYSENSIKSLSLMLNETEFQLNGCENGSNKECTINVDLSMWNGFSIEYFFILKDILNNIAESKKTKINVDTTAPEINIYKPVQFGNYNKKIQFNISLSEIVTLEYMDNSDIRPRWFKLCSSCNEFGFTKIKTKTFKAGHHELTIRAIDKAGNSNSKQISFSADLMQ